MAAPGRRPLLFYAATCAKCRILSRVLVIATMGVLQREPLDGPTARAWYAGHPEGRGRLMLVRGDQSVVLGRWVYPAVPGVVARAWLAVARWAAADVTGLLRPGRARRRPRSHT